MLGIRRPSVIDVLKGSALYLGLGFSLGWYYTITYFGGVGWPLPLPEGLSVLVLYYFSVLNETTVVQAIHWMVLFPVAGALWALLLVITAPFFGVRRPLFSLTFVRFGLTALPLTLAGPCMAFVAGSSQGAFYWQRMMDVALRRGFVEPWKWLNWTILGLALVSLLLQLVVYRSTFDVRGKRAWVHYLSAAVFMAVLACGVGVLLGLLMRGSLEYS